RARVPGEGLAGVAGRVRADVPAPGGVPQDPRGSRPVRPARVRPFPPPRDLAVPQPDRGAGGLVWTPRDIQRAACLVGGADRPVRLVDDGLHVVRLGEVAAGGVGAANPGEQIPVHVVEVGEAAHGLLPAPGGVGLADAGREYLQVADPA